MRDHRGFTLIELMIVVVVIGILAAIAAPSFANVSRGAKSAEARMTLKEILTLEERFKARDGIYTTDVGALEGGSEIPSAGKYFSYSIAAHASGFCAVASPRDPGAGLDAQSLDAAGNLHPSADCT